MSDEFAIYRSVSGLQYSYQGAYHNLDYIPNEWCPRHLLEWFSTIYLRQLQERFRPVWTTLALMPTAVECGRVFISILLGKVAIIEDFDGVVVWN
jgi:hypothetical protein